jgi:hypothetical protein
MSCPNLPEPIQRLGELVLILVELASAGGRALSGADPVLWERIGHAPGQAPLDTGAGAAERIAADPLFSAATAVLTPLMPRWTRQRGGSRASILSSRQPLLLLSGVWPPQFLPVYAGASEYWRGTTSRRPATWGCRWWGWALCIPRGTCASVCGPTGIRRRSTSASTGPRRLWSLRACKMVCTA